LALISKYGWLLLCLPAMAWAGLAEEWRSSDESAPAQLRGETVWLQAAGQRFWAVYRQSDRQKMRGTVILLTDPGQRPVAARWLEPLSNNLHLFGWQILLLPPPPAGGLFFQRDLNARLEAADAFVQEKKAVNWAVIGLGESAGTALEYASRHPPPLPPSQEELEELARNGEPPPSLPPALRVAAVVDMAWDERGLQTPGLLALERLRVPVADFFQDHDSDKARAWAKQRRISGKANPGFRQLRFNEADSMAAPDRDMLARRLVGWLGNALRGETDKWPTEEDMPVIKPSSAPVPAFPAPAAPAAP
jgi:hypothetical protein